MTLRTTAQMNADFPIDTNAHVKTSIKTFVTLARNGELDTQQAKQILDSIGTYMDPKFEAAAIVAPTVVTVGTAGTTTYKYHAVPNYPMNDPTGVVPAVNDNLSGKPPYGRPTTGQELGGAGGPEGAQDERIRRYIGGTAAVAAIQAAGVTIATGNATLSATNYNNVTAPSPAVVLTGMKYDIVVEDGTTPSKWYLVAADVAPGAVAADKGAGVAGRVYTPYGHTEVALDGGAALYLPNVEISEG